MRMTAWQETKWLIASFLLDWVFSLTKNEMPLAMCKAFGALAEEFKNDPKWDVVPLRRPRPETL